MDEQTYQEWCKLHKRVARGEALSNEEQQIYTEGERQLDAGEEFPGSIEELRQARQRAQELEAERVLLQARYDTLRAKIADLEKHLSEPTRQLLGVGDR